MRRPIATSAVMLVLTTIGPWIGRSSAVTRVVPDDYPTIQAAVDSDADTVLVRNGTYKERLRVAKFDRSLEFVLRRHPESPAQPRIEGMTVIQYSSPFSFTGFHFERGVYIHTTGDQEGMTFQHCRLDSGLVHTLGDLSDLYPFVISNCTIRGDVRAAPDGAIFESDTLIGGGLILDSQGRLEVRNCTFTGPGRSAIEATYYGGTLIIRDNTIRGYERGIHGFAENLVDIGSNTISDCSTWGIFLGGKADALIHDNRIERCGTGIEVSVNHHIPIRGNDLQDCGRGIVVQLKTSASITGNRVLRAESVGIEVHRDLSCVLCDGQELLVEGNVVGRSGSHGVAVNMNPVTTVNVRSNTSYLNGGSGFAQREFSYVASATFTRNLSYHNQRYGLEVEATSGIVTGCNDWYGSTLGPTNGPVGPDDLFVDPEFCNIASDSLYLYSSSPLLDASSCGLVGALGQGCVTDETATLVSLLHAEPVAEGIELRWQLAHGALARETAIERGPAAVGPWSEVAAERRDDGGISVAVDRGVEPDRTYWYRLRATTADGRVLVAGPISATTGLVASVFELGSIRPNPSRGPIRIDFTVAQPSPVRLAVLDLQGRELTVLAEGVHRFGRYCIDWNGETRGGPLSPGLYFIRYQAGGRSWSKRLAITY